MRNVRKYLRSIALFAAAAFVTTTAIGSANAPAQAGAASTPECFAWPTSLAPFGDGYPKAGDVCRRLGESPATSAYLDHTRTLVGCPGGRNSPAARAILRNRRGRVVGEDEGVTLISVPNASSKALPPKTH
jgi:hypothetical protein